MGGGPKPTGTAQLPGGARGCPAGPGAGGEPRQRAPSPPSPPRAHPDGGRGGRGPEEVPEKAAGRGGPEGPGACLRVGGAGEAAPETGGARRCPEPRACPPPALFRRPGLPRGRGSRVGPAAGSRFSRGAARDCHLPAPPAPPRPLGAGGGGCPGLFRLVWGFPGGKPELRGRNSGGLREGAGCGPADGFAIPRVWSPRSTRPALAWSNPGTVPPLTSALPPRPQVGPRPRVPGPRLLRPRRRRGGLPAPSPRAPRRAGPLRAGTAARSGHRARRPSRDRERSRAGGAPAPPRPARRSGTPGGPPPPAPLRSRAARQAGPSLHPGPRVSIPARERGAPRPRGPGASR